jgi:hypothetical protein
MWKKFFPLLLILGALQSLGAQSAPVTLSTSQLASVLFTPNTQLWIPGTLTVTKNDPSVTWVTIDLSPKATSPGNSRKYRQEWTNVVTNTVQKMDMGQIYFSQSTNGYVIYMWGSDGDGGSGVSVNNVFSHQFPAGSPAGSSVSFSYYVLVQNASTPSPGTYEEQLTFRARLERFVANSLPTTTPVASLIIRPSFVVSPQGDMKLFSGTAGTSEISTLSFGTVTGISLPQQFRINVTSNYRYSINVSSRRGGVFFHELDAALPAGASPTIQPIPYTFSVDGIQSAVGTNPTPIVQYAAPTGSGSAERLVSISIGDVSEYTAGKYSDYLSFTMIAM